MPEQGSAIVFNDCFDNGEEDGRSLHAGQPPLNPATVKYAINGWIRSRSVYRMDGSWRCVSAMRSETPAPSAAGL